MTVATPFWKVSTGMTSPKTIASSHVTVSSCPSRKRSGRPTLILSSTLRFCPAGEGDAAGEGEGEGSGEGSGVGEDVGSAVGVGVGSPVESSASKTTSPVERVKATDLLQTTCLPSTTASATSSYAPKPTFNENVPSSLVLTESTTRPPCTAWTVAPATPMPSQTSFPSRNVSPPMAAVPRLISLASRQVLPPSRAVTSAVILWLLLTPAKSTVTVFVFAPPVILPCETFHAYESGSCAPSFVLAVMSKLFSPDWLRSCLMESDPHESG